jgi:hypothetical protein
MAEPEIDDVFRDLIPEPIRRAYSEEQEFIDRKVKFIQESDGNWGYVIKSLSFLPYIGDAMTEQEIGPAAATSDVNRESRFIQMLRKIEAELGPIDDETKANIRKDIEAMYNGSTSDD